MSGVTIASARAVVRVWLAAALACALLCLSAPAFAVGNPKRDWWTIETTHFRVHYPREVEVVALRVAALAESIHERLTVSLGYVPKTATEIVLTDDTDAANGSAIAVPYNTIRLNITAPDDLSPLGDYDDWYLELVTHEYTHILHTDNISGVPAIVNAIVGKTLFPNRFQPNWVLEGLAVVKESEHSSGGRLRGTLYEMFLRADVLEDNIASLDQVSNDAYRWPQRTLWYLYGSRFLAWITDVYGTNTMRAVAADYGSHLIAGDINRTIRRVTGRTYVELYEGFKDHIRRKYAAQEASVTKRGLREGTRITHFGRDVGYPRFVPPALRSVPGREEIVFFRDDANQRSGIYRMPLAAPAPGEGRPVELVARTAGTSIATFTPAGDLIFNSVSPYKNFAARNDLYLLPRGETATSGRETALRRLTSGLRATAADVSPDGRRVAFVVNGAGTTHLQIADLDDEKRLKNQRTLVPSARFEQAYTPRFSPDGRLLAYSAWTAGGYRDVRIVELATGAFIRVTHDRALDVQPTWSPDGKTVYFASDRSGISNVYAYELESGELLQVTNVRTGAFSPAVSPDGKTLVYTGYSHLGYDLWTMPLDRRRFLPAPPPLADRPDPPAEPSGVPLRRKPYNPLPTLGPRTFSFEYKPGNYGNNALTLNAAGSDVVGLHGIGASVVVDTSAPSPNVTLDYVYRRLPVDLAVRAFHATSLRGGYRIGDEEPLYHEAMNGITTGVTLPIPENFGFHSLGLSYSAVHFKGDLPGSGRLDPFSPRTKRPPEGMLGIAHFGYTMSSAEGSIDASGPVRGSTFSLGLDVADTELGSDFSLRAIEYGFTTYLQMPWPGNHTLALRSSGAMADGTYPRGGYYFVGGYDLENQDLLDTITTGAFNGAFVMRGYEPRTYAGRAYVLQTAEYRLPIWMVDRGLSTLPAYFRRLDGNLFVDFGGAFDRLLLDEIKVFDSGYLLNSPQLHTSVGAELWMSFVLGYGLSTQLRLGHARGFSREAIPGGQTYFVAAGTF